MFTIACAALLWPGLSEGKVSGFRDGLHFYFPQAVWLDQCAERGEYFPQWQPHEALGVSVPGETTSAIYYPLRIVMLLPGLSVAQRMAAFVFVHLLIAALGMAYACERWRLREEAGWMSGVAFALCCPVFFQLHNLVFLCSAAWLGFVLAEVGCWLRCNGLCGADSSGDDRPRMLVLACALALIVLAGDPHTAVNVVLVCVGVLFVLVVVGVRSKGLKRFARMSCWLALAVSIAVGLSAVQSVPTLQWSLRSHRLLGAALELPVQAVASESTVSTSLPMQPPELLQQILSEPSQRPANAIYEFSLSPWHLLTTLWPTVGGDYSAGNSRVFAHVPAEGRMWIPSLFFGVVPLLLLIRKRVASSASEHHWLVWVGVFALLASFGNYSIGWLVRELVEASGASEWAGKFPADHTTSVYGVLADYVPGYALFRYPAKWSVIAVACFVLAAAVRFDHLSNDELLQSTRMQRVVMWVSGVALVLAIMVRLDGWLANALRRVIPNASSDAWLGPPLADSMWRCVLFALLVPLAIVGTIKLIRMRSEQVASRSGGRLPLHALMAWLCLLELFVVATNWISFVAVRNVMPSGPFTPEFIWADPREGSIARDRRLLGMESTRLQDIADYQRQFELGKLALLDHRHNLAALLSIEPERLKSLRSGLSRRDDMSAWQGQLDEALAWLGVEKRLVRERTDSGQVDFYWQSIANSRPLCEFFADSNESAAQSNVRSNLRSDVAKVSWQWVKAGRLEIVIDTEAAGQLLVRQFNDGGWQVDRRLAISTDASGLFVQIALPAGRHQLSLMRNPWPLRTGAAISFATLLSCIMVAFVQLRMASATRSRSK